MLSCEPVSTFCRALISMSNGTGYVIDLNLPYYFTRV